MVGVCGILPLVDVTDKHVLDIVRELLEALWSDCNIMLTKESSSMTSQKNRAFLLITVLYTQIYKLFVFVLS